MPTPDSAQVPPVTAQTQAQPQDTVTDPELHLAKALALIHRVLPRLDEQERFDSVQAALRRATDELTAARTSHAHAHSRALDPCGIDLDAELVAVIAAAVAAVLDAPHHLVDISPVRPSPAWASAWTMEGRFKHHSSHRVR